MRPPIDNRFKFGMLEMFSDPINSPPTKIIFLIPALDKGGAERQLVELVKAMDKSRFAVFVITFYSGGEFRAEIENLAGVHLLTLRNTGRSPTPWNFVRLWTVARKIQPDIMIGYLNLPSIMCSLVGRTIRAPVVWCLRSSEVDYARYGRGMRWSFKLGAQLSRLADLIILNSSAGKTYHREHGYYEKRMIMIPNGIDTCRFRPVPEAGSNSRRKWGIGQDDMVIGLVGRLDLMKDHPTFLRAAARLIPRWPNVRFVCVGGGPAEYANELQTLARDLGIGDKVVWAGDQNDMPSVYCALDLLVSSSSGEGFSNVIGEAMACGVPCVVTDVGDSALIVGETGTVVRARDPERLSDAMLGWLNMDENVRSLRKQQARDRIEREFNLQAMVNRTQQAIQSLINQTGQLEEI